MNKTELSTKKTITLDELIKNKEKITAKREEKKTAQFYIESLDSLVTVTAPDRLLVIETQSKDEAEAQLYMIYNCVTEPNLKNTELHQAYGCVGNPMRIVEKIFTDAEIPALALKCYGVSSGAVKDVDIKN